ncbi:hypothetical protein DDZ18_06890 [Marinicauda salina]|jgi:hypothetical protein|uniref:Uncharacterized protein n=1 Tax=Marinicauda salina TaxID=2135793 RepID=A0A2U2BTU9_9PROT|nr:hypothetical protein [Marinicauda salina]PWE17404.1 hypothetical protein DDZ18_06890 [Marinicauda salina]
MEFEWGALFEGEAMRTWIRIMQWVWALGAIWIATLLLRNGFTDLDEIIRSRHATPLERLHARVRKPVRAAALLAAAVFGATSFALPLWFQGAIVILVWRQVGG